MEERELSQEKLPTEEELLSDCRVKLNLGCGREKKEGFLNVDIVPEFQPDVLDDVTILTKINTNSADGILARDVIEHVSFLKIGPTLRNWCRVLKKGGKLVIQTPNIQTISQNIIERIEDIEYVKMMIRRIYGGQEYETNYHFNSFTPQILKDLLEGSGFEVIASYPVLDLKAPDYDTNMTVIAQKR